MGFFFFKFSILTMVNTVAINIFVHTFNGCIFVFLLSMHVRVFSAFVDTVLCATQLFKFRVSVAL